MLLELQGSCSNANAPPTLEKVNGRKDISYSEFDDANLKGTL